MPKETVTGSIAGLISPHAGYMYSGQTAAYGYKALIGARYDTVIVVAPAISRSFSERPFTTRGRSRPLWDSSPWMKSCPLSWWKQGGHGSCGRHGCTRRACHRGSNPLSANSDWAVQTRSLDYGHLAGPCVIRSSWQVSYMSASRIRIRGTWLWEHRFVPLLSLRTCGRDG